MKHLTDDLLNKYIDNELTSSELEEVEEILSVNPDELKKLKAQKMVDESLSKMKFDKAPEYISVSIMNKILGVSSVKNQKPYFLYSMLGIFGAIISLLIGYLIYTMPETSNVADSAFLDKFNLFISQSFSSVSFLSDSSNVIIIGISLTFLLIIGFFMMLNFQRHALSKLNNFGH